MITINVTCNLQSKNSMKLHLSILCKTDYSYFNHNFKCGQAAIMVHFGLRIWLKQCNRESHVRRKMMMGIWQHSSLSMRGSGRWDYKLPLNSIPANVCPFEKVHTMYSLWFFWTPHDYTVAINCRLVEGVPTSLAAVANHSCVHNSLMASVGLIQ